MSDKKIHKEHPTDQVKHNHKEAFKGHRTKKHYINEVQAEEAEQDILNESNNRRKPGTY
jgi:hypothetical protein